ncbi:MAG: hypothetical protein WCA10_12055 [Terracidiphilus sp.]
MASRGNFVFGIRAFDSSILVESADSEIRDALDRYIFPPLPRSEPAPSSPDIHLFVDREEDRFRVEVDQKFAVSAVTLHDASLGAVKALDDVVVHRMKMYRAIHAGAVLIEGRALLVPGSSHAGKSSLVAELLRRGASHFSDEYALIDGQGRIHSYPRPLLLRKGGLLQTLVLPEELDSRFATNPAPVGWILALDYSPGATWDVQEMSQGEAVMLLLRNTPHEIAKSPEMIDFFLRVADKAVCFAGARGDAAEAATQVFDLISHK